MLLDLYQSYSKLYLIISDRVGESSVTTGTGDFTLAGALSGGYQTFANILNDNEICPYVISNYSASEWETGIGKRIDATTLKRFIIYKSSNGGQLVNFTSGMKSVSISLSSTILASINSYILVFR